MKRQWREESRDALRRHIDENPDLTRDELRARTPKVYPFGAQKGIPYRVWLDTIQEMIPLDPRIPVTREEVRNLWLNK